MKVPRASAHTRAMTPGSMLGGWKCTATDPRETGPKKVAEPVAVSSTEPLDFPHHPCGLPRTAYRLCFDLLPHRARRNWEFRGWDGVVQDHQDRKDSHFAN